MQQTLAQHLAVGVDGFAPRRFQIGKFLALVVAADIVAFSRTWKKNRVMFAPLLHP